jgi:hypothetical protein
VKHEPKRSTVEHIVDGNLAWFVRLEDRFNPDQLRSALPRVQQTHPALRALIREAPEIALRAVPRMSEDDYRAFRLSCHAAGRGCHRRRMECSGRIPPITLEKDNI